MNEKITVTQAFNNLANTIESIRFLPSESNKIQQAMQILGSVLDEDENKESKEDA